LDPFGLAKQCAVTQFLRVIAMEAGRRKDASWAGPLLDFAPEMASTDAYSNLSAALPELCANAMQTLLGAGAPVNRAVVSMASSTDWRARRAVALGVRTEDPKALALLQKLSTDPERVVRQPAQEKLAELQEVPWWLGLFDSDPLARLGPAQAESLAPALQLIAEYTAQAPRKRSARDAAFAEAVTQLPDDLAGELVSRLAVSEWYAPSTRLLLRDFVRRATAAQVFWKLLKPGPNEDESSKTALSISFELPNMLKTADSEHVLQLIYAFAKQIAENPEQNSDWESPVGMVNLMLPSLWRPTFKVGPLLDVAEELSGKLNDDPTDDDDDEQRRGRLSVLDTLLKLITQDAGAVREELWRLVEIMRKLEHPGQHIAAFIKQLRADQCSAFAEKFHTDSHPDFRTQACELLLVEAQASGEADEPALFLKLFQDTAFRAHVFGASHLLTTFAAHLRAKLLAGALTLSEAATLMGVLKPASDAEWVAFRSQQRAALASATPLELGGVLGARPDGPWRDEDLELCNAALARLRSAGTDTQSALGQKHQQQLALQLVHAISNSFERSLCPALEEAIEVLVRIEKRLWFLVRRHYRKYCEALDITMKEFGIVDTPGEELDDV
jgi:hypothetical protein